MRTEIRDKIEKIRNGHVPEGYKRVNGRIIPIDWEVVKIGDVVIRQSEKVEVEKDKMYQQIGIRSHGKGLFYKEPVTGEQLGNKSVYWVQKDCFIVNIVFAWEQAIAKTTETERGMIASHRFPMYLPIKDKLNLDFMLYQFKTKRGKTSLELASPGGAGRNKTLGQKEFQDIELVIPQDIEEQKEISNIILTWEKAIELKERLIELKKEQKWGIMSRLLTGEVRLEGYNKEWNEFKLGSIATIVTGTTPSTKISEYYGGKYPWITPSDISEEKNIKSSTRTLTDKGLQKGRFIPKGSLLVTCIASIGKNVILDVDGSCNQQINAILPSKEYSNDFLYYLLSLNEDKLKSFAGASATQILNKEAFSNISFKIPEFDEQVAIAGILESADKEINLLTKELRLLKEQKKGLMQLLLTGIVRVNNQ